MRNAQVFRKGLLKRNFDQIQAIMNSPSVALTCMTYDLSKPVSSRSKSGVGWGRVRNCEADDSRAKCLDTAKFITIFSLTLPIRSTNKTEFNQATTFSCYRVFIEKIEPHQNRTAFVGRQTTNLFPWPGSPSIKASWRSHSIKTAKTRFAR